MRPANWAMGRDAQTLRMGLGLRIEMEMEMEMGPQLALALSVAVPSFYQGNLDKNPRTRHPKCKQRTEH